MDLTNTLLLIIAIGIWAIWYEIRYGIDKRRDWDMYAEEWKKEQKERYKKKWDHINEERKSKPDTGKSIRSQLIEEIDSDENI